MVKKPFDSSDSAFANAPALTGEPSPRDERVRGEVYDKKDTIGLRGFSGRGVALSFEQSPSGADSANPFAAGATGIERRMKDGFIIMLNPRGQPLQKASGAPMFISGTMARGCRLLFPPNR